LPLSEMKGVGYALFLKERVKEGGPSRPGHERGTPLGEREGKKKNLFHFTLATREKKGNRSICRRKIEKKTQSKAIRSCRRGRRRERGWAGRKLFSDSSVKKRGKKKAIRTKGGNRKGPKEIGKGGGSRTENRKRAPSFQRQPKGTDVLHDNWKKRFSASRGRTLW